MENKFEITAISNTGEPIELILREGEANPIKEVVAFKKSGLNINSIVNYVLGKDWPELKKNNALILFCKNYQTSPRISYFSNPQFEICDELHIALEKNPDILEFAINSEKLFTQKELERLFRKKAHCFESIEAVQELIKCLQTFEVKFEQSISKADDRRGVSGEEVKKALKFTKGEIPSEIKIKAPLYLGDITSDISLSVEIDAENGSPKFSFYSIDIEVKMQERAHALIIEQIDKLKNNFICLELDK